MPPAPLQRRRYADASAGRNTSSRRWCRPRFAGRSACREWCCFAAPARSKRPVSGRAER